MVHGSVVMKREAPGVGGEATHFSKSARSGAPPVRIIQIKNEQRYNRDAGEGGHPPIHGVSATAATVEGKEVSTASRAAVEQYFTVHNTPTTADPLHRTIELPNPVTQPIAVIFNKLFGRL